MQIRLPESQRVRQRTLGGTTASVGLHVATIALAVVATARGPAPAAATPAKPAPVVYRVARPEPVRVASGPTRGGATPTSPARRTTALPIVAPIDVPSDLPPLTLPSAGAAVSGPGIPAPDFAGGAVRGDAEGGPSGGDGPLAAHLVDRAAVARVTVTPRYPETLRARALEGEVAARFVVDSTGRVAPGSFAVLSATHELFADAVRSALERTRFAPAERGGRPVAQLVEQRFTFRLGR